MARSGRPKKEPFVTDKGTPELQEKRKNAVGESNDANLSSSILDIHLARKLISLDEHKACLNYLFYHNYIYGSPFISSSIGNIEKTKSDIIQNETQFDVYVKKHFKKIDDYIIEESVECYDIFRSICIYEIKPQYLDLENHKIQGNPLNLIFKKVAKKLVKFINRRKTN